MAEQQSGDSVNSPDQRDLKQLELDWSKADLNQKLELIDRLPCPKRVMRVLRELARCAAAHDGVGCDPSIAELGIAIDRGKTTVLSAIQEAEKEGYIEVDRDNVHRNLYFIQWLEIVNAMEVRGSELDPKGVQKWTPKRSRLTRQRGSKVDPRGSKTDPPCLCKQCM